MGSFILFLLVYIATTQAFSALPHSRLLRKPSSSLQMLDISSISDIVLAGGSTTEDGIVYGSVNAPNFVPFVGAFFVIILAGLPALLTSGKKLLNNKEWMKRLKVIYLVVVIAFPRGIVTSRCPVPQALLCWRGKI